MNNKPYSEYTVCIEGCELRIVYGRLKGARRAFYAEHVTYYKKGRFADWSAVCNAVCRHAISLGYRAAQVVSV